MQSAAEPNRSSVAVLALLASAVIGTTLAAVPEEVSPSVQFLADKTTLTWSDLPTATSYNVYRGVESAATDLRCFGFHRTTTQFSDAAVPGVLYTYLVSAVNSDGEGTLGDASDGTPRSPQLRCVDTDGDLVRDDLDNCPLLQNPLQLDQDGNGRGDGCDPNTFDFESDTIGTRPAGVTEVAAGNGTLLVSDYAGDKGVSYGTGGVGGADRFDRLELPAPQTGEDLWIDTAGSDASLLALELWSDGTKTERAGQALAVRIGNGKLALVRRTADTFAAIGEVALPTLSRLRLRLRRDEGGSSRLHVDSWNGSGFDSDAAVFNFLPNAQLFGTTQALVDESGVGRGLTRFTRRPVYEGGAFAISRDFRSLTDWQLVQRNSVGQANLRLAFRYNSDEAARVEWAVEDGANLPLPGFDFADHPTALVAAPQGAWADASIPAVPQGGNYRVVGRLVRQRDAAILGQDQLLEVAIGDLFLAVGQSNMSGYSGTLDPAEPPVPNVHLFGNDYLWKQAVEPMDSGVDQVDLVSSEAPVHSLMLRFAKELSAQAGVPVAIIPAPLGGTNLYSQWQRNAAVPDHRGTLYGSSIHRVNAQRNENPIRGTIWYQGESDAGRGTDLYLQDLRNLVANYRSDLAAPAMFFGNCQLSNCANNDFTTWIPIQEAQRRYALEDPRSAVVALVDLPRNDTIHLSVAGYKEAGRRLAVAIANGDYGKNNLLGPKLQQVKFATAGRDKIQLIYDKAVTGGTLAVIYHVFEFSTQQTISSVTVSGTTITLQMLRPLSANNTFVSYGYNHNSGSQWIASLDGAGAALAFDRIKVGAP